MFDTVRFFRLPKMFHLPNKSNSRGLSSSEVLDFFELLGLSQVTEDDCSICRISRISKYWLLERCSIWCRISEDILSMLWQCSSGISGYRVFNNVRFSRRLSQITEDALFVELGGFPKINFFDTAQFAEFVGWPKMFDNVPFFSEIIQDVEP